MALQRGACPRQLRVLVLKPEQLMHDRPAFCAIIAQENCGGAQMQFFDRRETRKTERFTRDNNRKRQRGGESKSQSEKTEALAAREQVLDQTCHAKPEAEQDQSADRGPEHRAPAKTSLRAEYWRLDRDRQQRRVNFRRDVDRAAGRPA